jgi:hypothetical protein
MLNVTDITPTGFRKIIDFVASKRWIRQTRRHDYGVNTPYIFDYCITIVNLVTEIAGQ